MSSNFEDKWMNPCGRRIDNNIVHASGQVKSTKEERLAEIVEQSKRSYQQANEFKEKFAKKAFKIDWSQLHDLHKSYDSYSWLPGRDKIPKSLGEHLSQDHLESLELEHTLGDIYEYLQLIAVGLDQMVLDEKDKKNSFEKDFIIMEQYVLSILCEVQTLIGELNFTKRPDVQRSVFPADLKNGDNTNKNMRNYMILREYLNILEYVTACIEHLKTKV